MQTQKMSVEGWGSIPEYSDFVPSYVRDDGKPIDARYSTYVLAGNGDDGRKAFRVNFWGPLALAAKEVLMDTPRIARFRIKDAKVSTYVDRHEGQERFSINVNSENEYEVLEIRPWAENGNGFHSLLAKVQHQHENPESMDEIPF